MEALQDQTCQDSLLSGEGRSLGAKISRGRGTHFAISKCKLHRVMCRRFNTIPACDGRTDGGTDGQTDGIGISSTALVMRALRRAVKNDRNKTQ